MDVDVGCEARRKVLYTVGLVFSLFNSGRVPVRYCTYTNYSISRSAPIHYCATS